MKILIFIEGTILMHALAKDVNREERVKQSRKAGIQREERQLAYEGNISPPSTIQGSVYDFNSYIPINNAVSKITYWKKQGAKICYLTSRRIKEEINQIRRVLSKCNFPDHKHLYFRRQGEDYKNVAERLIPDILIEDNCESIGGEDEMVSVHINPEIKKIIKVIIVEEFGGIDHLANDISELIKYPAHFL